MVISSKLIWCVCTCMYEGERGRTGAYVHVRTCISLCFITRFAYPYNMRPIQPTYARFPVCYLPGTVAMRSVVT